MLPEKMNEAPSFAPLLKFAAVLALTVVAGALGASDSQGSCPEIGAACDGAGYTSSWLTPGFVPAIEVAAADFRYDPSNWEDLGPGRCTIDPSGTTGAYRVIDSYFNSSGLCTTEACCADACTDNGGCLGFQFYDNGICTIYNTLGSSPSGWIWEPGSDNSQALSGNDGAPGWTCKRLTTLADLGSGRCTIDVGGTTVAYHVIDSYYNSSGLCATLECCENACINNGGCRGLQFLSPTICTIFNVRGSAPSGWIWEPGSDNSQVLLGNDGTSGWTCERLGDLPPSLIFADGFESSDTSAWSSVVP